MSLPKRSRPRPASGTVCVLLAVAAVGTFARGVGTGISGAGAALAAVVLLLTVAWGALRSRPWALGAAFLLGVFWLWASVALGLQGRLSAMEVGGWILWSLVVMVASVRTRRDA